MIYHLCFFIEDMPFYFIINDKNQIEYIPNIHNAHSFNKVDIIKLLITENNSGFLYVKTRLKV
jgi:hypothetical protein